MARHFPFPLPDGWFAVSYGDELTAGQVRPLRVFGRDLVLFRTEAGQAHVLDAHCPHLGAHLGFGGRVAGEAIQCPSHGWCFGGDGVCRAIPSSSLSGPAAIPAEARIRAWPVVERNQMVWVWHHGGGAPPAFDVPVVAEANSDDWTPLARHVWQIRTRNQEMGENAVDRAHFRYVHGTATLPDSEIATDGVVRRAVQRARMTTPRGEVDGCIESISVGMGIGIVRFTGICETVLLSSTTPVDDQIVETRFGFTQRKVGGEAPRGGVGAAIIRDIVKQMNEDIPIWENKIFLERPKLCDGDGPIGEYRRWARQFYSGV